MSLPPNYPSYEQRAFNLYQNTNNPNVEYLRHPSGVIVVRLGPNHECMSKEIEEVRFDTTNNRRGGDLTKQVVIGKGKKGGTKLNANTKLCSVECTDGSKYVIRSGIKATLIEANARLLSNPKLLTESRDYAGFLAIVIPPAVLNSQRVSTIPSEFDKVVRVGTEIPSAARLLSTKKQFENETDCPSENCLLDSKRQRTDNED